MIQTSAGAVYSLAQGTNAPVSGLAFTSGSGQSGFWEFPLRGYTSGDITLSVYWYAAATSGNVKLAAQIGAITVGTDAQSWLTKALATLTNNGDQATNGTANAGKIYTITLTGGALDSAASGDLILLRLTRLAANASEMSGDAIVAFIVASWS